MIVSGLEIIYGEEWDDCELQIVNPAGKKMVCGRSGFHDHFREEQIKVWAQVRDEKMRRRRDRARNY
jgi:hypothetical protein